MLSIKSITCTNEFKIHFIAKYNNGKTSKGIFSNSKFYINGIEVKRIECASFKMEEIILKNEI